jgi:cell division protein FtsB
MSKPPRPRLRNQGLTEAMALLCLLVMAGMAFFGPSGLVSWSEHRHLLEVRRTEVKALTDERDTLRNRVALLNPRGIDPDLAGELLRKDLNVVHPDEVVILLD